MGFFEAPASTIFQLNKPGGLLQYSINVYDEAIAIREKQLEFRQDNESRLPKDSITIVALLHDACKAAIYKKDRNGRRIVLGKSVIMLLLYGLKMTEDEILGIRWHMDAWEVPFQSAEAKANLSMAKRKCPLLSVIKAADGLASFILE